MIDDYVGGYSPIEQENIELECQVDRLTEENEQLKQQIIHLEQEKCELLGIIQKKDELIQKMKICYNCESHMDDDAYDVCKTCSEYSEWRLASD